MKIINGAILAGIVLACSAVGMEKEQPTKRQRINGVERSAEEDIMKDIASLMKNIKDCRQADAINEAIALFIPKMEKYSKYFNTPFPVAITNYTMRESKLYTRVICEQGQSFFIYFLKFLVDIPTYSFNYPDWQKINPTFIECLRKEKVTSVLQPFFINAVEEGRYELMLTLLAIDKDLFDTCVDGKTPFSILENKVVHNEKTIKMNSRLDSVKRSLQKNKTALKSLQDAYKEREKEKQESKQKIKNEFGAIQVDRIITHMKKTHADDALNFMLSLGRK